jgi:nitrite reductase (NADH) small subunit
MERIKIANAEEIAPGTVKVVQLPSKAIAVCNVGGAFYAVDNICPHRGALLGQGTLNGTVLTCPWHQWKFDVTTGKGISNPLSSVACHPAMMNGSEVFVEIELPPEMEQTDA